MTDPRSRRSRTVDEQLLSGRQLPRERIPPNAQKVHRTEYSLETDVGIGCFLANEGQMIDERPVALARWSYDDYICEQMWGDGDCSSSVVPVVGSPSAPPIGGAATDDGCFVTVVSEGIPDAEIVHKTQQRLNIRSAMKKIMFTAPSDYVSVSSRRLLLPVQALDHSAFGGVQVFGGVRGGVARLSRVQRGNMEKIVPRSIRHTFALRGCSTGLSAILDRIERIRMRGVVNYSDVAQHGYHLSRANASGLELLQRNHQSFLTKYLTELTEGSAEVQRDVDRVCSMISNPSSGEIHLKSEWKAVAASLNASARRVEDVSSGGLSGLYLPHFDVLRDFLERAQAMSAHARGDSAKLIRETVSRRVLQDRLRALVDVHFNAWVTLRLKILGPSVQVGDLVLTRNSTNDDIRAQLLSTLDPRSTRRDHSFAMGEHLHYDSPPPHLPPHFVDGTHCSDGYLRIVDTEQEAASYQLEDVVMPLFGSPPSDLVYPKHRCGKATSDELVQRLQLNPLQSMSLLPACGYRPLVVRPRNIRCFLADDIRSVQHGDLELASSTFIDSDGFRRLRSPVHDALVGQRTSIARPGIVGAARKSFLELASRPGFSVFVQFEMPVGASPNSVIRELVKAKTVDPSALLREMMMKRTRRGR